VPEKGPRMTQEICIRPLREEDFSAWKGLWDGFNAFYGRQGAAALPEEVTRMTWTRFFDAYEPMHALVAERDGVLLGLVHFLFHRSSILLGPSCYLQDLFAAESARGQGVGRALIAAVEGLARSAGAKRLYWQTQESNATAMRLYDQIAEKSGSIIYQKAL